MGMLKKIFRKGFVTRVKNFVRRRVLTTFFAKDYSIDPYFNPDLVQAGFANRKSQVSDKVIFERIIKSYNQAKAVQLSEPGMYQVGNEWLPIYQSYMSDIMTALSTGSVEKVSTIYNNFFREPCSVGLHGLPVDMFQHFFVEQIDQLHKKQFLNDFLHRYRLWRSTIGHSAAVDTLKSPDIGNPYGFTVDNVFIRAGSDYLHYYASMIARLIRGGKQRKVVVELGGGFGGMPYYLVRDNSDITYVDFDLPENLALTAFYLLSAFPDKRVALYGEVDIETLNPCDYDVVLMPNFEIARMPGSSADLVFNSYSLAEMSSEAVDNYLAHFNRLSNKFIFHINHTRDSVVKADEFKVDLNKFELVYRAPALWNMARNIEMDEFEYLFKNKSLVFAEPQVAH